jgi:hypothetical protein
MAHPVAMLSHELPLYTFNTSFVVSYHCIPSIGELGADALTVAHGIVFDISLLPSMFIHAPAVYVVPVGACHVGVPLTLVNTSQLLPPLGTHTGTTQPSFMALPVVPSNTARCPLTAPLGHDTSHVPAPCADITLLASIVIHAHAVSFGWKFRSTYVLSC